jgi:hypothetical protein
MIQNIKKLLFLVFLSSLVLFSFGCDSNKKNNFDKSLYKFPTNFEFETHEIENIDGYKMQIEEINHTIEYDLYKKWQNQQSDKEALQQIEIVRTKIKIDTQIRKEEERLIEWCNNLVSNSCLEMKWYRDLDSCRKVEVECLLYNCDNICRVYDIVIKDDYYPLTDCKN